MNYFELSRKADELYDFGKIKEATNLLLEGLALAKNAREEQYTEFFLGELEYIKGGTESALVHNIKAVKLDPENSFLIQNLGVVYSLLRNYEEAIKLYDQALEIKPDDHESLRYKGIAISKLGNNEEAIKLFDQALKIKPDDYDSLRDKGITLSKLGNNEEAIKLFDQALKIKPDDYDSLRDKGITLSKLGNYEEAIKLFDQALEIKPDDYKSLRDKGITLSKLGNYEEAIELYDQALKIKPEDWYSHISKAFALEKNKKYDDAKEIITFLHDNIEKIKDKEIIEIVKFKDQALEEKIKNISSGEIDKGSDVLNEVINAFTDKKDAFFTSINEIESNFREFIDSERSIPKDFPSFLSVLRKWNSYTPIIPSERGDNKGGGYFLYHGGKGIVIDPGFNFIENFYQEGFKVADIDAVLITHAHNDHTVDLESILTLVYKHNDAIEDSVKEEMKDKDDRDVKHEIESRLMSQGKKIDLFLNVGTFMKYSGWLNLKDSDEINSVTILQPGTTYHLTEDYCGITIHATKAKHHEVIDNKYAIGFILDIDGMKVGFTGDTGWDYENNGSIADPFLKHKPRLVVAHLGSIKSKEFKYVEGKTEEERNKCFYAHHLGLLGMTQFLDTTKPDLCIISEFGEELRNLRKEIVQGIGDVLKIKCLPGDIGLYVRLHDLGVHCFIDGKFVDYKKIQTYYTDVEPNISFHRAEPDHEKFNAAKYIKNRNRAVPICKRIKDLT